MNEIAAWKRKYVEDRSADVTVMVKWKRGHPEKHKRKDKGDWDVHDHGIFWADAVADEFHTKDGSIQVYDSLSHDAQWCLWWRGVRLVGQLRKKVVEAMRIELISMYMCKLAGDGQPDSLRCIPSAVALCSRSGSTIADRVLKAKVLSCILGTLDIQLMRGHVSVDSCLKCRMCGKNWETVGHVLWECTSEYVVEPRAVLVAELEHACATIGDGLCDVLAALWKLGAEGQVESADWATLKTNLTENDSDRRLTTLVHKIDAALTPRSDDPTGLYSDRVGLLGNGWVGVLEECGLTTSKAEHLVFSLTRAIHGPKGVRRIWGGFTSKLQALSLEAGTGPGETPRHLTTEQEGLWIRIQAIREELVGSEDRHCEFGKLSVKGDVSIWRAWLDEYVAHREAGECKDESVDCAFRFAWNVSKARNRLRGKAGNAAKKLVRELGLKAFKKQHYEKIPYFRTILDEELVTELIAAGWIDNDERQGGERAGVGLAERAAQSGRRPGG